MEQNIDYNKLHLLEKDLKLIVNQILYEKGYITEGVYSKAKDIILRS